MVYVSSGKQLICLAQGKTITRGGEFCDEPRRRAASGHGTDDRKEVRQAHQRMDEDYRIVVADEAFGAGEHAQGRLWRGPWTRHGPGTHAQRGSAVTHHRDTP